VTTPINHVLRSEQWPCERLQSFTGQTVCIQIPPLITFKILIDAKGETQQTENHLCADTTLTLSPFILPRILAREATAFKQIRIIGNQSFAEELINIGKQINFSTIFEHDLSKIIGDIAAHRVVNTGKHLIKQPMESLDRISQAWIEYWTEENIFLTKHTTVNQFIQDVKNLQLNIEKLEQRFDRLLQQNTLTNK
jgi:ubiquinone biosynthesis protein UbiJ